MRSNPIRPGNPGSKRLCLLLFPLLVLSASCNDSRTASPIRREKAREEEKAETLPTPGGELRLPLGGVQMLDPAKSTSFSENQVIQQIFQGLVRFDSQLRVVPDLAKSWSPSEDRKVYTFLLHPEARFHNGRTVTSEDVAYTIRRLLDRRTRSSARAYLKSVLDGGEEAITCLDPQRVEIRLKEPDNVFISFLAMQHTRIVPQEEAEKRDFRFHPIGSGPFRFISHENNELVLSAFREAHHNPLLDRVVFIDVDRTRTSALREGILDHVITSPGEAQGLKGSGDYTLTRVPNLTLHFLGFNQEKPPFDDLRVRQAIAHGLDRNACEERTQGRIDAAKTVLPPGMPGYDPTFDPYPTNREKARSLLAEAGFGADQKEFPKIEIFAGRIPAKDIVTELLIHDLAAIGIEATVKVTDDYGDYLRGLPGCQAAILGWGADYPDPENFFTSLFRTGATHNFMNYSNEDLDDLIDEGRRGTNKVNRAQVYREAERILLSQDCVIVPMYHDAALHCVRKSVNGLAINALGTYYTRLDSVWISDGGASRLALRGNLRSSAGGRDADLERGSSTAVALEGNGALVGGDDLMTDVEPKSGSRVVLGRKKRLEDLGPDVLGNTRPIVRNP